MRQRAIRSSVRTPGRSCRCLRRINERQQAEREIVGFMALLTAAILVWSVL